MQQLLSRRRRLRRETRVGSNGVGSDGAEGTGAEMMTGAGAGAGAGAAGAWTTTGPLDGWALSPRRQLRELSPTIRMMVAPIPVPNEAK